LPSGPNNNAQRPRNVRVCIVWTHEKAINLLIPALTIHQIARNPLFTIVIDFSSFLSKITCFIIVLTLFCYGSRRAWPAQQVSSVHIDEIILTPCFFAFQPLLVPKV